MFAYKSYYENLRPSIIFFPKEKSVDEMFIYFLDILRSRLSTVYVTGSSMLTSLVLLCFQDIVVGALGACLLGGLLLLQPLMVPMRFKV
jgi:hypothetical protein